MTCIVKHKSFFDHFCVIQLLTTIFKFLYNKKINLYVTLTLVLHVPLTLV
jgi:hypothetical protein